MLVRLAGEPYDEVGPERHAGDAGTVAAHIKALPSHLLEPYVANARRALARAVQSGRLSPERAERVREALEEAMVR